MKERKFAYLRVELKGKCQPYDEKNLKAWFNLKKSRAKKTSAKKYCQSLATASVAGDLGTMDDFEQPTPKLPIPLTLQTLW
jgi:hypothetical protein